MNLGDKLKPCPFCGKKMTFIKETKVNSKGDKITTQYYMHENVLESRCILDEIDMPFVIGAGDANGKTGYIGEYASLWNKREIK